VEVVTVLQSRPEGPTGEATLLPTVTRGLFWTALVLDVIVLGLMIRMGTELDTASSLLSMITLGGHHRIVAGLAAAGLLLLAVLAPWTQGFERADRVQLVLLPIAGVLSLTALAGLLCVLALAAGVVLVAVLLFRPRARIDVVQRKWW
jgi:hypothetical protein